MPPIVMLESSVTFLPQLRGAEQRARSPRLDHAYSGRSETVRRALVLKNTKRSASVVRAITARQAALRNSSRSEAPTDLFFGSIPSV